MLSGDARALLDDVVAREEEFVSNEPDGHRMRHGWVLTDPPPSAEPVLAFVRDRLPELAESFRLGFGAGPPSAPTLELTDVGVTAHRDGDFLGPHHDDGWPGPRNGRLLSFVYWFHHQPRSFGGGDLSLRGWERADAELSPTGPELEIQPDHDRLVVFPSVTRHQLRPVSCTPDRFASARFAVVGFVRRRSMG